MRMEMMYACPCASIEESGWERIVKIRRERKSVRRWNGNEEMGNAMKVGVAISSITRMFIFLTRARTSISMGVSES